MKNFNQYFITTLISSMLVACSAPIPTNPQVSPIKTPSVLITKDKIGDHHTHEHDESVSHVGLQAHFETWLQTHHATKQEVVRYQAY